MSGDGERLDEVQYEAERRLREEARHREELRKLKADADLAEYQSEKAKARYRMEVGKFAATYFGVVIAAMLMLKTLGILG